eukprot:TRINITY_DN19265_c0_g1_i1.p2 TRINITY_DN19265_c0_g1~~TRINITY_DN19265_c0_g1_i1.p2  ORF type:complete len:291 (+),score=98.67 TRINITY_DN19265_c0_g1_i1:51-875(+)
MDVPARWLREAFTGWTPWEWAAYVCGVYAAMWLWGALLRADVLGAVFGRMGFTGRVLRDEDLCWKSHAYVVVNKGITCVYLYQLVTWLRAAEWVAGWGEPAGVVNTVGAALLTLGVYDAVYVPFHRALHLPGVYAAIHKHHHMQINPFRSMFDGINVHPVEFVCGEYLHAASMWCVGAGVLPAVGAKYHVAGVVGFFVFTSLAAPLNHTRWTIRVPYLYDVRTHDTHHKFPRSNYCQYVPWWDHLCGTFLPYERELAAAARARGIDAAPELHRD